MVKQAKRVASRRNKSSTIDPVQRELAIMNAQQQFVTASLNMGWQLAIAVVVPIVIGINLDKRFDASPSFVLASFVLATILAVSIVSRTIKNVNREMAEKDNKEKKRAK